MRTVEISAAGQSTCAARSPRPAEHTHQTRAYRPAKLREIRLLKDEPASRDFAAVGQSNNRVSSTIISKAAIPEDVTSDEKVPHRLWLLIGTFYCVYGAPLESGTVWSCYRHAQLI